MKDVTHDDDINFRQRILKEISSLKPHSVLHPAVSNKFLEDWLEPREDRSRCRSGGDGRWARVAGYHALS